ncbi:primosomal protein N' [Mycoplasmatota bacterium]|nr:primosomal protein N' [Mycoplasmatota bacterium]
MIAEVIVDVKVKNLNRPFSYSVPSYFEEVIEIGMRVKVPFGSREILGFVVDLKDESHYTEQLKPIIDILDITPSLTDELLVLAKQMSQETSSFLINCIQAMLPTAIKAKYMKKVVKLKEEINPKLNHYFSIKNEIVFDKIIKNDYHLIKKAIMNHELDIIYEVKDKLNIKYEAYLTLIDEKKVTGKKQQEVIDYLKSQKEKVKKSFLMKQLKVTSSTIKSLINKKIIKETSEEIYRNPYEVDEFDTLVKHTLNKEQQEAFSSIIESVNNQSEDIFLLHGVTGSGKTEVYLNAIEEVIALGKEAIMLVPEISLTPQIVRLFKLRFGQHVAVLHSGLSIGEKYDEWRRIRKQEVKVVVGARSAVFAPFTNLGIIIIDEEHESTYKQSEIPKYHAIEIAKLRAKKYQATLVLGSATPSLESYARAIKKVYRLLELTKRATLMEMPKTTIVNMSDEFKSGNLSIISKTLEEAILDRIAKNEQIILLLNRRGYDNFLMCRSCGYTVTCQNCDISLTYHKFNNRLKCHYCGYEQKIPTECPQCRSSHLKGFGYGTQKVEEIILKQFPMIRLIRMDNDTTSNKGDHERLLTAFKNKEADILLGTQMIAKGLDFEDVTLVGVLSADTVLKLPDYKASEKTFQLLTQVSGRAGRHKENSDVIIQTYNPNHYAIILAAGNHYKAFFNQEMKIRKMGKYIPYYFMAQIVVTDEVFQETLKEANKIVNYLKNHLSSECLLLGPVIPQIKRLNNLYSSQIIVKYKKEPQIEAVLESLIVSYQDKSVNVIVDRYPNFLL